MHLSRIKAFNYQIRIQICLIVILLCATVLFRFPSEFKKKYVLSGIDEQLGIVTFDIIEITSQNVVPAAPTRPTISISDNREDVLIDLELDILFDLEITSPEIFTNKPISAEHSEIVLRPQRSPRVLRIVEPTVPTYVNEENIRAIVEVTFTIGVDGTIEEIIIDEISLYNRRTGLYNRVEGGLKGIVESTLQAAQQWQFRPAINDGIAVRSKSTHVFTFGRE
jgi:hypothetical protein